MVNRRLIPCLDVRDGKIVKGVRFEALREAGDPVSLAKAYAEQGADELVVLDVVATVESRHARAELVRGIADQLDIPFTVGGGVRSVEDASTFLDAGADKVAVNSAAVLNPGLITEIANRYGSQCVVLAIDAGPGPQSESEVFTVGGRKPQAISLQDWAREGVERGAGEILYTAIEKDGTRSGYDLSGISELASNISVPIIASGGAGSREHFAEVLQPGLADAALAASLFHFGELLLPDLREFLRAEGIPMRSVLSSEC
jgi:cyclase